MVFVSLITEVISLDNVFTLHGDMAGSVILQGTLTNADSAPLCRLLRLSGLTLLSLLSTVCQCLAAIFFSPPVEQYK